MTVGKMIDILQKALEQGKCTKDTPVRTSNGGDIAFVYGLMKNHNSMKNFLADEFRIDSVDDVSWSNEVNERLKYASENDEEELDTVLKLCNDCCFKIDYLSPKDKNYNYLHDFMEEHGLL